MYMYIVCLSCVCMFVSTATLKFLSLKLEKEIYANLSVATLSCAISILVGKYLCWV